LTDFGPDTIARSTAGDRSFGAARLYVARFGSVGGHCRLRLGLSRGCCRHRWISGSGRGLIHGHASSIPGDYHHDDCQAPLPRAAHNRLQCSHGLIAQVALSAVRKIARTAVRGQATLPATARTSCARSRTHDAPPGPGHAFHPRHLAATTSRDRPRAPTSPTTRARTHDVAHRRQARAAARARDAQATTARARTARPTTHRAGQRWPSAWYRRSQMLEVARAPGLVLAHPPLTTVRAQRLSNLRRLLATALLARCSRRCCLSFRPSCATSGHRGW